jgi:hypothetical protein
MRRPIPNVLLYRLIIAQRFLTRVLQLLQIFTAEPGLT